MPLNRRALGVALGLGSGFATLLAGAPANQGLALQVSSETAPAGGWAQIKVYAAAPHLVAGGSIAMDFDAAVFGDIANVAVFSATGDALGYANVSGRHVDAHFSSPSGGIGQLPGQPLFVVPIPLLAGAKAGTSAAVILDPSGGPWTDAQGNSYAVTVTTGAGTVGGLSVASVTPGCGILPAGSVLQIAGTGFDATTTVAIEGAAVAAVRFINSQQMEVTLSRGDGAHQQAFPVGQRQRPDGGLLLGIPQRAQRAARGIHRPYRNFSAGTAERFCQHSHRRQPALSDGRAAQPGDAESNPVAGYGAACEPVNG
jgi:hypothetical protein